MATKPVVYAAFAIVVLLSLAGPACVVEEPEPEKPAGLPTFKQSVAASRGVVATNHPLASAAGQMILAKGGNAVDAIVAAYFALSVVEPAMSSPFGSGFINLYTAEGEAITLDNYTVAPGAAAPDMYRLEHPDDEKAQAEAGHVTVDEENRTGFKAIGVPGNLKAWLWAVRNHGSGKLSLRQLMGPAIDFARNGVRLSPAVALTIGRSEERCGAFPGWGEQFLLDGEPPEAGALLRRPAYASTLEALAPAALEGASLEEQLEAAGQKFYKGDIARNVVRYVRENGGILSMEDLAWYYGDGLADLSEGQGLRLRTPIRGTYREFEIIAMPPTSSGGTHIVEILNILEGFDLAASGFGTAKTLHLMTEAMKIAWADRDAYMGDPDYAHRDPSYSYPPPPVEDLIDKDYGASRRAEIDPTRAGSFEAGHFEGLPAVALGQPLVESANTTHATAMDDQGNVVSMTQTLNHGFGSCVALPGELPGSGLLLNNTMALFDPDPRPGYERANGVAPRKRQLSSMSPTIVLKDGKPFFALGTPGGTRIYATVLQGIVNVIDHGMSIQQAVEAPRIWTMMYGALNVEEGFSAHVTDELEQMGHTIERVRTVAGGMNGVLRDPETGLLYGGACWRRDGSVAGWSGGDALPPSSSYPLDWKR
jgi:gamma-glutamyltranspeptidase/glutathione hydrolase